MKVRENPSLHGLNTFGIRASAGLAIEIETEEDLLAVTAFNPSRDLVLGGGSNIILLDDVPGTVYLNRITGIQIVGEDGNDCLVEAGAGESWHGLVRWSLDNGLNGLENLSLIPGCAGAAPIQNIGAYGVELDAVVERVSCWDWQTSSWVSFDRAQCGFAYRDSRFKSQEPDRYLVTSIRLRLSRRFTPRLSYSGLDQELQRAGVGAPTARDVSEAVIRLRRRKLPDPATRGNAGSFFKNPVVDAEKAAGLRSRNAALPAWRQDDGLTKLSAGWMIEQCGLKGVSVGDAAVSRQHALVLVNRGNASGRQVAELAQLIQSRVRDEYGIELEPEPRLVRLQG
jgi:UDP-N-acetylmuramate dehydrogenase